MFEVLMTRCLAVHQASLNLLKLHAATLWHLTILSLLPPWPYSLICSRTLNWFKRNNCDLTLLSNPHNCPWAKFVLLVVYNIFLLKYRKVPYSLICILWQTMPTTDWSGCRPTMLALTADNWLDSYDLESGQRGQRVFLSRKYKFRSVHRIEFPIKYPWSRFHASITLLQQYVSFILLSFVPFLIPSILCHWYNFTLILF